MRGYLAIGDYSFARTAIDNFLAHQARNVPGVTKGELPMIISGKAFLHSTTYGSADSTFLFPWAIREYVVATGDRAYLKKRWGQIVDLVDWGLHKDLDGDGFVEHGFTGTATSSRYSTRRGWTTSTGARVQTTCRRSFTRAWR